MALLQGCQKHCKDYYYPLDGRLFQFFFKPGTYWVYRDSATGMIDSQYVYAYKFRQHYTYTPAQLFYTDNMLCGPIYWDDVEMVVAEYQNQLLFRDSIKYSSNGEGPDISFEGYNYKGIDSNFHTQCLWLDTIEHGNNIWTIQSISVNNAIYHNVIKVRLDYSIYTEYQILYATEFYFAAGYGIIRKVEYRPTGTVSWDLMRYQFVR